MQEVLANSQGVLKLGPGTLYRSLQQLLVAGYVVETAERPDPELDDERRRYYQLTALGRRAVQAEAVYLDHLVNLARANHLLSLEQFPQGGAIL